MNADVLVPVRPVLTPARVGLAALLVVAAAAVAGLVWVNTSPTFLTTITEHV